MVVVVVASVGSVVELGSVVDAVTSPVLVKPSLVESLDDSESSPDDPELELELSLAPDCDTDADML